MPIANIQHIYGVGIIGADEKTIDGLWFPHQTTDVEYWIVANESLNSINHRLV
jgi:hypothetical protein